MHRLIRITLALALLATASSAGAAGDWTRSDDRWCDDGRWGGWNDRNTVRECEVRETVLSPAVALSVDGGQNGGIRIVGDDRSDILVRAKVQGWGESRGDAVALLDEITIRTDGHHVEPHGPRQHRRGGWSVAFEILVPRQMDLDLRTHNGGVDIDGVDGEIRFDVLNGGVRLDELAGDVVGHTTNGGLKVTLEGSSWNGPGLDVESTNGGVKIEIPDGYAADLETGTVNGRIDLGFPITVRGSIGKSLRTELNGGGPPVRIKTTNGSVTLDRI